MSDFEDDSGCHCCQTGVSRIDVGYLQNGETVRIPRHFLSRNGYYIREDGFPDIPDYIIGRIDANQYPFVTEQDVFFLDRELTRQFQLEHLVRKCIFFESCDEDEESEEAVAEEEEEEEVTETEGEDREE
jgi:hypothetical protein